LAGTTTSSVSHVQARFRAFMGYAALLGIHQRHLFPQLQLSSGTAASPRHRHHHLSTSIPPRLFPNQRRQRQNRQSLTTPGSSPLCCIKTQAATSRWCCIQPPCRCRHASLPPLVGAAYSRHAVAATHLLANSTIASCNYEHQPNDQRAVPTRVPKEGGKGQ